MFVRPAVAFWIAASLGRQLSRLSRKLRLQTTDYVIDQFDDGANCDDDAACEAVSPTGAAESPFALAASVRCATRAELVTELGALLDAGAAAPARGNGAVAAAAHRRYCDALGRLARDALLARLAARAERARQTSRGWNTHGRPAAAQHHRAVVDELRAPLVHLGALEKLLCRRPRSDGRGADGRDDAADAEWCRQVLAAGARAVGCSDDLRRLGWAAPADGDAADEGRSLYSMVLRRPPRRDRRPSAARHAELAALFVDAAAAARFGRPDDADALRLRLRLRRRLAVKALTLVAAARLAVFVRGAVAGEGGLDAVAGQLQAQFRDFWVRRIWVPARALYDDLLLNKKSLGDSTLTADSERALEQMLRDWHADVDRRMPKAEQQRRAAAHDMTSVSDALTREVRSSVKNLLSGNIARALLLQLQFVSTEVYRSMGVIDDLLAANTATIQLLSLFPAAFLGLGVLRAGKAATIALLSESVKSTETVRREMAATLSEAHRIALLSKRPDAPPSDYALGALTLHVHIFRGRARREKARFHPSRLLRLDRALRDVFLPGLSAKHLRRLFQHVLDENDFLRLDSAQSLPRPMSLVQAGDI